MSLSNVFSNLKKKSFYSRSHVKVQKLPHLFFTERMLHPPGIAIEAPVNIQPTTPPGIEPNVGN